MTVIDPPTRLRDGDEFGRLLGSAEPGPLGAERLARVGAAVRQAAQLPAAGAQVAGASGLGAAGKLAIVVAALAAAGAGVWLALRPADPAGERREASPAPRGPAAGLAAAPRLDPPTHPAPALEPSAVPPAPGSIEPGPTERAPAAPRRRPARGGGPSAPLATDSALPEQIRLYDAARVAAARGDHSAAVVALDDLLARFPGSPLTDEAELSRAESLARAGRTRAAVAAVERLLGQDGQRGRRGELGRLLGDLQVKLGDCAAARAAYELAIAAGLDLADREAIRHGLARCGAR